MAYFLGWNYEIYRDGKPYTNYAEVGHADLSHALLLIFDDTLSFKEE